MRDYNQNKKHSLKP